MNTYKHCNNVNVVNGNNIFSHKKKNPFKLVLTVLKLKYVNL